MILVSRTKLLLRISEAAILMHHNRIKLNEIVEDVELTVVFLLEYVISFPHQSSGEKQVSS